MLCTGSSDRHSRRSGKKKERSGNVKKAEIKRSVMAMESICSSCEKARKCEHSTECGVNGRYPVVKCSEFQRKEKKT